MKYAQPPQLGDTLDELLAVCPDFFFKALGALQNDGVDVLMVERPVLFAQFVECISESVVDQLGDSLIVLRSQVSAPDLSLLDCTASVGWSEM